MHARPRRRADEVPVLDLTRAERGQAAAGPSRAKLRRACETIGFFYVANHGVPRKVVDGVFAATRRYFDLPIEKRMEHRIDERFRRGFMPQGINQHPGYAPDLKESYETARSPARRSGRRRGPAAARPEPLARRPAVAAPRRRSLLRAHARARQAPAARVRDQPRPRGGRFSCSSRKSRWCRSRLFHYPPQPVTDEKAARRRAAHRLRDDHPAAQDPIGGLELKKRDGEWVSAPWIDDTFVINLGDLFKVLDQRHLYVSNLHRVVNRTGKERYSIPTFFNLDYDAPVSCLPTCQSADNPPKYQPITSGDYLLSRFRDVQKYGTPIAA